MFLTLSSKIELSGFPLLLLLKYLTNKGIENLDQREK